MGGSPVHGYRWQTDIAILDSDMDDQGHLNHIAGFGKITALRTGYLEEVLRGDWHRQARDHTLRWVVGEAHVRYVSEGWPGERYHGRTRSVYRSGRALIIESELRAGENNRVVVHGYSVQIALRDGVAVGWPQGFLDRIEAYEQRKLIDLSGTARIPFGPFASFGGQPTGD